MNHDTPRRSFSLLELLVVLLVIGVLLLFAAPLVFRAKTSTGYTKCNNNVRQLALGAAGYASDHRFFPHVGGQRALDGDWTTPDSLRVFMALIHFGYADTNKTFVCISSSDSSIPMGAPQIEDPRRWSFAGSRAVKPELSPLSPAAPLGTSRGLDQSSEVSYGWTRKPMNMNAGSANVLTADRSVRVQGVKASRPGSQGNHPAGWNVAYVDASSTFLSLRYDRGDGQEPFTFLGATGTRNDGFLAMECATFNPDNKAP